ncbi:DUF4012 domain-containing protein [Candidatus Uhrbacteria bacterium]|nr:DUF4012 domain-containing protein [Candidatus Uhrbacteria bacterium]
MFFNRKKTVNLLQAVPFVKSGRERRRRPLLRMAVWVGGFLAVLGLVSAPFLLAGMNAYSRAMTGKAGLEETADRFGELDFEMAETAARKSAEDFAVSRRETGKFVFLMPFPWVGERLVTVNRLLETGQASAEALAEAAGVAVRLSESVQGIDWLTVGGLLPDSGISDLTAEDRRRLLAAVSESGSGMRSVRDGIRRAIETFDRLPDNEIIRSYGEVLSEARSQFESVLPAVEAILPLTDSLPGVLGYPDAKRYLFFLQNSTEMRPTGGFLGLVGQVTVRDGDLESIEVSDTYAYDAPSESADRPAAPWPLQRYANVRQWYLRDANWSPDFTVSAPLMERFFLEESEVRDGVRPDGFDGVIAVTPHLAEDILRLTGPIAVGGQAFTAENLVDELEFQVEMAFAEKGISRDDRKGIVGDLMREMIDRVMRFDLPRLLGVMDAVRKNLDSGNILLYSRDDSLQRLILERDWGGRMRDVSGDYLMAVDANIAALKTDPVVDRDIGYAIRPDGQGGYEGRVSVRYSNNGRFDWKTTRYRTYTRLYLPMGSDLIEVTGALEDDKLNDPSGTPGKADVGEEMGRQWFGAFISIEPGQSRTLEFRFALADSVVSAIESGEYRLYFERQSGTPGYGLTLDLDFGKKLTAAEPAENPENFGDSRYRFVSDLKSDREFRVLLR